MSHNCRIETCCPPAIVNLPADTSPCVGATDSVCAQYPAVCLPETRLILKPSNAQVPVLGAIQFKAFLFMDGSEVEITGNVLYTSSDLDTAIIGASSGNAIGQAVGSVVVTADYGGYQAFAELVVIEGECADRSNSFLMLFDVSKSSTVGMMGSFPTRLEAAKAFGTSFSDRLNVPKDTAAVMSFDVTTTPVQSFTYDPALIDLKIATIGSTQNQTNLEVALTDALAYFTAQGITENRIIVLFTDGEVSAGGDPTVIADTLKAAGIILMIVGLRAKQGAFNLLSLIASPGFFLNAIPSNYTQVDNWLNGLKSYICSGDCTPAGNVTVGVGELNFTNFINWDVTQRHVDLIGYNTGGIPVYDLLPGNGLYVDGCGSVTPPNDLGQLTSKVRYAWVSGKTYSLTLAIAGNQREAGTDVTAITAYDKNNVVIASLLVPVSDYAQGFTDYTLNFTPNAGQSGAPGGKIQITQNSIRVGGNGSFGNLWDNVRLRNVTNAVDMFTDTFDDDNPTVIDPCEPPPCVPPIVVSVTVSPSQACAGDTVVVSWIITGSTLTSLTVDGNVVTPALIGSTPIVLTSVPHTISVDAINACGSYSKSASVNTIVCVLSDWGDWMDITDWSECSENVQSKDQQRTRTVLVQPCPEGTPCDALVEYRTIYQPCGDCFNTYEEAEAIVADSPNATGIINSCPAPMTGIGHGYTSIPFTCDDRRYDVAANLCGGTYPEYGWIFTATIESTGQLQWMGGKAGPSPFGSYTQIFAEPILNGKTATLSISD